MEVLGYHRVISRHTITCKVCYSCFYHVFTMSLTILRLSASVGLAQARPNQVGIQQWELHTRYIGRHKGQGSLVDVDYGDTCKQRGL